MISQRRAHLADPRAELLGVRHGRRQGDDRHVRGQVNDHLLPHRAAHLVGQVVHLVEDNDAQVVQGCARVDHVAQHLGRHDDDRRAGVNRRVTGRQADVVRTVEVAQLEVLLVGQRLDGRRVEGAHAALAGPRMHRTGRRWSCPRPWVRRRGRSCRASTASSASNLEGIGSEAERRHPAGAQRRGRRASRLVGGVALGCTAHAEADFFLVRVAPVSRARCRRRFGLTMHPLGSTATRRSAHVPRPGPTHIRRDSAQVRGDVNEEAQAPLFVPDGQGDARSPTRSAQPTM